MKMASTLHKYLVSATPIRENLGDISVIFSSFFEPSGGQQIGKRIRYINSLSHFRAIKLCLFTWKHFEEPNILVGRANDAFSVKKGELRSPRISYFSTNSSPLSLSLSLCISLSASHSPSLSLSLSPLTHTHLTL